MLNTSDINIEPVLSPNNKAIVTVAMGDEYFIYAINQFISFRFYNTGVTDIDFIILTDSDLITPYNTEPNLIIIKTRRFLGDDEILLYKLYFPALIPHERVIFVDADNLIAGDARIFFHDFKDYRYIVFGDEAFNGNWRYDIDSIKSTLGLTSINRINGCFYYYNKAFDGVAAMFEYLITLIPRYDELKLTRVYNNLKDDEVILAIGCSKINGECWPNNGRYKAETMHYAYRRINLLTGNIHLWNDGFSFSIDNYFLSHQARPLIVAFDRDSRNQFDYNINVALLKAVNNKFLLLKLVHIHWLYMRLYFSYLYKSVKDRLHFYKHKKFLKAS